MWAALCAAALGTTSAERLSIFTTATPVSPSNCWMTLSRRRRKLGLAARLVRWSRVVVAAAAAAELLLAFYQASKPTAGPARLGTAWLASAWTTELYFIHVRALIFSSHSFSV